MIYTFRVLSSRASLVRMGRQKNAIVKEIVTQAEQLDLGETDHAIFDYHGMQLKIVVQFPKRLPRHLPPRALWSAAGAKLDAGRSAPRQ